MGSTRINVGEVIGLGALLQKAGGRVLGVRTDLNSIRNQLDERILNRNNLFNRLQAASSRLSDIESRITRIKSTAERGANSYSVTDLSVRAAGSALAGKLAGVGLIAQGGGIGLGAAFLSDQAAAKTSLAEKGDSDDTFSKILKDDWKLEGALAGCSAAGTGQFLGLRTSGKAEGELIGGSVKTESKAKWNIHKGDAGIEKSVKAEGHAAKGSLKGSIGALSGKIGGTVGNIGATGTIGATLYKDGKLTPGLQAKVKGEASVLKADGSVSLGNEAFDAHSKASGTLLGAEAEASGGIGVIRYEDTKTGRTKSEFGVKGKVRAEAYAAQGKLSGGIKLFGIKIDAGISGKAGGAGLSAEGRLTTGGLSGKIGAGLGLGAGVELSIDWSECTLW